MVVAENISSVVEKSDSVAEESHDISSTTATVDVHNTHDDSKAAPPPLLTHSTATVELKEQVAEPPQEKERYYLHASDIFPADNQFY